MFNPDNHSVYSKLGIACAGLGMYAEAETYGQKAYDYAHQKEYPKDIAFILYDLVQLYAIAGDQESARQFMDELLTGNIYFTTGLLKYDPDIQFVLDIPGL